MTTRGSCVGVTPPFAVGDPGSAFDVAQASEEPGLPEIRCPGRGSDRVMHPSIMRNPAEEIE
jgi:hypothetical protein